MAITALRDLVDAGKITEADDLSEVIEQLGYDAVHNPVYDETEMVYSLFYAADQFPTDEDLLTSYGDIVYKQSVVDSLRDCDALISVVVDLS